MARREGWSLGDGQHMLKQYDVNRPILGFRMFYIVLPYSTGDGGGCFMLVYQLAQNTKAESKQDPELLARKCNCLGLSQDCVWIIGLEETAETERSQKGLYSHVYHAPKKPFKSYPKPTL